MKRRILRFGYMIAILSATICLVVGCRHKNTPVQREVTLKISVDTPAIRDITLHKSYPGYLTSEQTVELVARVDGYLQSIQYAPGSLVRQGDLLFIIEPTLYENAVRQAEAGVKSTQAQLDYARNNYTRMQEAMQSNAISEIELIRAETNVSTAISAVKNASAQLKTAKTNLSYCYVRAPFSGRVSRNKYDIGNYINGSVQASTLATIYKEERMLAYFNVEDNQYLKMMALSKGNEKRAILPSEVTINAQELPLNKYKGKLDYLSPNIELSTGTLNIRATVNNPDGELKSGLYVTIDLPYGEQPNAILIDNAAIGSDQLGKYVYVVNDSNIVNYRHIETGQIIADTLRQVISGLKPQEKYVTKALLKVKNGMKVIPIMP